MLTVDVLYFHVTRTVFWIMMGLVVALVVPRESGVGDEGS